MISAIVLAAGEGKRMGETKQLLLWRGKPILQHVLDRLRESRIDEIILVVGYEREKILQAIDAAGAKVVFNPDFSKGMIHSVRKGLSVLHPQAKGFFLVLGDQPAIGPAVYDRLIEAFHRFYPQKKIFLPAYGGVKGHPALFGSRYAEEAMQIEGDVGLRDVVRDHPEDVMILSTDTGAVLEDLDTPADYQRLKKTKSPGEDG